MNIILRPQPGSVLLVMALLAATVAAHSQLRDVTPEKLDAWLKKYPEADANKDGRLTAEEAQTYYAKMRDKPPAPSAHTPSSSSADPDNATLTRASAPAPTLEDIRYGPAGRNVLDLWLAPSRDGGPTPLVIYIHGGGFHSGDKTKLRGDRLIPDCLAAGVSVAAINYRYLSDSVPLPEVLKDCARALQFIRYHADAWRIDKTRIASFGTSAGAGTSLWLAFHDDMADPHSPNPISRESTRLTCAGSLSGQFSYDFPRWGEIFGEETRQRFGGRYNSPRIYGFTTIEELSSPAGHALRANYDIHALISPDDPPVFVSASLPDLELKNSSQFLHHPKHSQLLYDRCREQGVPVVADIPALHIKPDLAGPQTWTQFVIQNLTKNEAH